MKKVSLAAALSAAFLLAAGFQGTALAAEKEATHLVEEKLSYSERVAEKFGRGVENLFVCWLEIPHQIVAEKKKNGGLSASTVGVGKGLLWTGARLGTGAYEIVSCPYPQDPIIPLTEEWEW